MQRLLAMVVLGGLLGCGVGAVEGLDGTGEASEDVTGSCSDYASPDQSGSCHCPSGGACSANGCDSGKWCHLTTNRCVNPPSGCSAGGSSGSTGSAGTSGGTSGGGSTGSVGPSGGTVSLLHFGLTGDTRPPSCNDTSGYPSAIINGIADQFKKENAQFALDLGDHMFVCDYTLATAQAQMQLYQTAQARYPGTWFMTMGNHECSHSPCLKGSQNANYVAFMDALAPIASLPYYSFDVKTEKGLATFVIVADNAWDSTQASWLESTLSTADSKATYTIVARHHPQDDTSVPTNADSLQIIRKHKLSLLLTGHSHQYEHQTADAARDLVLGTGGAPLVASGSGAFNGYALVDQLSSGELQVSVYDVGGTLHDRWSVSPNQ